MSKDGNDSIDDDLTRRLFKKYCIKPYLKECEPEFCSARISNTCKFIALLQEHKGEL